MSLHQSGFTTERLHEELNEQINTAEGLKNTQHFFLFNNRRPTDLEKE